MKYTTFGQKKDWGGISNRLDEREVLVILQQ